MVLAVTMLPIMDTTMSVVRRRAKSGAHIGMSVHQELILHTKASVVGKRIEEAE